MFLLGLILALSEGPGNCKIVVKTKQMVAFLARILGILGYEDDSLIFWKFREEYGSVILEYRLINFENKLFNNQKKLHLR